MSSIEELEKVDKQKTKVLKFLTYKKRTENEIRNKFKNEIEEDTLEDIIEYFKEVGYINDKIYIEKSINEFTALKNLSIKEIKYKLYTKGIKKDIIEEYIQNNYEKLQEYEKKSAQNIKNKKQNSMNEEEIKIYLLKKGYEGENI